MGEHSLIGLTRQEAADILRGVVDSVALVVRHNMLSKKETHDGLGIFDWTGFFPPQNFFSFRLPAILSMSSASMHGSVVSSICNFFLS